MTYDERMKVLAYCENHGLSEIMKRTRWVYEAYKSRTDEPWTEDMAFAFVLAARAGLLPEDDEENRMTAGDCDRIMGSQLGLDEDDAKSDGSEYFGDR